MEDMTMGQRLAECRKRAGLSQEALGEKLGVSRQAISKWEADAAVPEIDKLISLSKLYGVSVGWLLGVEPRPEPAEEKTEVSEELLRKIEEIVLRYRPRKAPMSTKKKVLIGILAALLLWGGFSFADKWSRLTLDVATTGNQVRNNNEQNARIMDQLRELEARLEEPKESLLSDYQFEIFPMYSIAEKETNGAEVKFTAAPTLWREGDVGILAVRHNTLGTVQETCTWDGSFLTASVSLEEAYGYELCFTLCHADGTQEQQMLSDELVEKLSKTLTITFRVSRGDGVFSDKNKTLTLRDYHIYLEKPAIAQPGDTWTSIDYVLFHHHGLEYTQIGTYDLLGPYEPGDPFLQASTIDTGHRAEFTLPDMEEGDGLVLWLDARMSNGMRTFTIVDQWTYSDGSFENLGGEYSYS